MSRKTYLLSFIFAFLTPFIFKFNINNNNTCNTFYDYFFINFGGDCYYNSDADLNPPELLKKYTKSVQIYNVTTEDGYILSLFRIRRKNPIGVILLEPPISGGAMTWLLDRDDSIGITLWKKGYEVWFGNIRGSIYSRKHVNLRDSDPLFWDFSFHEVAVHDFDSHLQLIYREANGSQVIFIGYSLASTSGLIYASLKPENSSKFIKSYILVAPLSVLQHLTGAMVPLFYLMKHCESLFGMGEFLGLELLRWLGEFLNSMPYMLNFIQGVLMGWENSEMDPTVYPYLLTHYTKGISHKMLHHYGQIYFNQTHFVMYDYGKETNSILYGSDLPPPYPLEAITTPMYIVSAGDDTIATSADLKILSEKFLPKNVVKGLIEIPNNNHVDFIFGKNRKQKFYEKLYKTLESIN